MKSNKVFASIALFGLLTLTGCNGNIEQGPTATAVFYLEGGTCKTNTEKVSYVYPMTNKTETYIADPLVLDTDITRVGYHIENWYQERSGEEGSYTYSDPWNFSEDKMGLDGVTLYAGWAKNIKFSYDLYYKDEMNEDVYINQYIVNEGALFDDYLHHADDRDGYTAVGFLDTEGKPWNDEFQHPGGNEDLAIKVYVDYIKGDFTLVRTANELTRATSKNIYLVSDIDMEGKRLNFGNYNNKTFLGNGHTISNFEVSYTTTATGDLFLGIFHTLTKSTIKDVTFSDVKFNLLNSSSRVQSITLGTVAGSITDSVIENVSFSGTYSIDAKTNRPVEYNVTDVACVIDEASTITNCTVSCQFTDNREN